MKTINTNIKIIAVYILIILFCTITAFLNHSNFYDEVVIIQDKQDVIKKMNMSIPIKIQISNEKLGNCVIENEDSIKNIWSSINQITNDSLSKENDISKVSEVNIKGTVYYLNGTKDEFEVSNVLKVNHNIYYDNYKVPIISDLRNNLLIYFYSPENLSKFINSQNKIILVKDNKQNKKLSNEEKEKIRKTIEDSIKVEKNIEIMQLKSSKEKALNHIKIYIDEENSNIIKVKSYNLLNIDVYNDFFVVQYMGDENGNHIYMKCNLNSVCKEII